MTVRREALRLGLLGSVFALFGSRRAAAAEAARPDALTIGPDGITYFKGKRNFFSDVENAGDLRVGGAWGIPGIYSEKGAVVVGSQNGNIWLRGKVGIGVEKTTFSQSLDVAGTVVADSLETRSGVSLVLIPVGTIMAYGGDTRNADIVAALKKEGWLPCDGSAYSAQDYPKLAEVVGNSFGTLRVPDLRGRFLRGTDQGKGRDPDAGSRQAENGGAAGDKVGSVQEDEFRRHTHEYTRFPGNEGAIASGRYWQAVQDQTGAAGGNETRPKNVNVNLIIRAK